jgi:hypothetical protein
MLNWRSAYAWTAAARENVISMRYGFLIRARFSAMTDTSAGNLISEKGRDSGGEE